jgi:hypothetical protein
LIIGHDQDDVGVVWLAHRDSLSCLDELELEFDGRAETTTDLEWSGLSPRNNLLHSKSVVVIFGSRKKAK